MFLVENSNGKYFYIEIRKNKWQISSTKTAIKANTAKFLSIKVNTFVRLSFELVA